MNQASTGDHAARLARLQGGCTPEQVWDLFDELPAARAEELSGRWKGSELATGHSFDGLLTASGWYGKQFEDTENVHPLLFAAGGDIFAVEPRSVAFGFAARFPSQAVAAGRKLLSVLRPVLRTRKPRARLRNVEYRGKVGAAMIYDHLPIIDVFRRVDENTLVGVMDSRNIEQPYFFVLRRD